MLRERADASRLGGVMATVDHNDAVFHRLDRRVVRSLADDQCVDATFLSFLEGIGGGARPGYDGPPTRSPVGVERRAHRCRGEARRECLDATEQVRRGEVTCSHYADLDALVAPERSARTEVQLL